jgi:TonB-dependent receptor
MQRLALRASTGLAAVAVIGCMASPARSMACANGPLAAALLKAARQSHFQLAFNPLRVAGKCADGVVLSGRPEIDLPRLAHAAGLDAVQVQPGLIALTETPRPAPTARTAKGPSDIGSAPRSPVADKSVESVIVTGRLATGPLVQKRFSAAESSILSAQQISERPVSNVVEAVSILPGLSTYADMGLGQSATGDPEFITVRGIDSSDNVYELNGVRTPETDPYSRALSLKMLPPFGLQSVQIVKTPTAEMDGDSIGGVVDIHTATGFDFAEGLNRITVEGDLHDLAARTGLGGLGGAVQVELARRLLNDRLAVYVTGYVQQTHSVGESGEVGDWLPKLASQSALTNYRQVTGGLAADEYKWDVYTNQIQTYGGNLSVDYRSAAQSLYLRLIASRYDDQGADSQFSLRQQLANTGVNAQGQPVDTYGNAVGPGLPGIAAYASQQTSLNPGGGAYNSAGFYDPNGVLAGSYFQLRDQVDDLYTLKLGGATNAGDLSFSYSGAYGFSRQARPDYVEGSSYGAPLQDARLQINWLNGYTPSFVLTPAQQAYLFNPANTALWKLQGGDSASADSQFGGKIDADYRIDQGWFRALHAGVNYSNAYRSQYDHNFTGVGDGNLAILTPQGYAPPYFAPAGPTLADQPGTYLSGSFLNFPGLFRVLDRGPYVAGIMPYIYRNSFAINPSTGLTTIGNPGVYTINDYNAGTAYSTEQILAAYVSADFQAGALEIYPGLREEFTFLNASYWDYTRTAFDSAVQHYSNLLPSLNLVYRPGSGRWVYRAAVRQGFSRPAIGLVAGPPQLSSDSSIQAGDTVIEGNPKLLPTTSINYDVAVEYYGRSGSLFELDLYRKSLSHVIYGDQSTGAPPQANQVTTVANGVTYAQYVNGGSGYLNGLEVNLQQRLIGMPEPLDRLTLGANATFQHSEADSGLADHFGRMTWLPRAPELIYNLGLGYEGRLFKADLTYQYTGLQLENLTSNDLDNFLQPTRFLDLKLSTMFRGVRWSISGKNLTDGPVFWKTLGPSTRYLGTQDAGGNGSYVLSGRVFNVTATKTW